MTRSSNRRNRLVIITVLFLAISPTLGIIFTGNQASGTKDAIWFALLVGALALALGWFTWSDHFIRQIRNLLKTTSKLASGDFKARTGRHKEVEDLVALANAIDTMAESLENQIKEREKAEWTLLNRTHQQTAIAALGQFALTKSDFDELLEQAVNFMAQIVEIEYCGIWEKLPDNESLLLRKGAGWKKDAINHGTLSAGNGSLVGHLSAAGGAVTITDLPTETRFSAPEFFTDHGVVSGICAVIPHGTQQFGVLGVFATKERKFSEDEFHFLLAIATVIAMAVRRRQTENELQRVANFAQFNPNPVMEFDADGRLTYFNAAAMSMAKSLGKETLQAIVPPDVKPLVKECLATGNTRLLYETRYGHRTVSWSFFPIVANSVVHCYAGEITEKLNLEAQLRQSQKMESVGQLAAGVAHDFNNMLTIIQGHSGVIMSRPTLQPELLDSAQAIYFASERAANLTRQLLMFSRKNIVQHKPLDLREVVGTMSKMLQRMIGEVITFKFEPPAELAPVHGDAGMVEQVIMNLAVNARDAMYRNGGTLTLTLEAMELAADQMQFHPEGRPGKFIRLDVADTGSGMTPEIQSRIFEPFFTTKEVGKGTGLGLATVYGIVKQHEGWVEVSSEVGRGTTFSVFFLAAALPTETKPAVAADFAPSQVRGGKETILVVEDEPVLRDLAKLILAEYGYRVLLAGSGMEALQVWEKECANIDLVLTDLVMPEGMSGKVLAEKLKLTRHELKIVCVSGYSMDDIAGTGMVFLQKPYTRYSLAKIIRDTLDGKSV